MNNELTAALLTIEKCRELSCCPAGVDLQDWVKQLAAESLAMRETIEAVRGVADNSSGIAGWNLNGEIAKWSEILPEIDDIETPATDRIVAGIKADGVDIIRNALIKFVEDEVGPNDVVPGLIRGAEICVSVADSLREGDDK
ncbi:hypothetical protein ABK687_08470 [Klebsiella aerogenes]|uniref:hypothetical protein n=1 Tax=Klebsiella aerogenes TaxID=548 RepID=UPI0037500710